jgi:hypothetical protein
MPRMIREKTTKPQPKRAIKLVNLEVITQQGNIKNNPIKTVIAASVLSMITILIWSGLERFLTRQIYYITIKL